MRLTPFKPIVLEKLKNTSFAIHYLTDAVEENDMEGFLLALRDIIEARGGIGKLASKMDSIHRVSLYKALSKNGNPMFTTVLDILKILGLRIRFQTSKKRFAT